MTVSILPRALGSNLVPDHVFVGTPNKAFCVCPFEKMQPEWAWNLPKGGHRLCLNCGRAITRQDNDGFNRCFGYSGYDEEHDYYESQETEDED